MTDDPNRQQELKKMALCEPCAGIQRNWRRAPGHAELVQGGNRQEKGSRGLVTVTEYRCDRCGTAWAYENDKGNQQAGWSVVGR
jgi:hypothetical protein